MSTYVETLMAIDWDQALRHASSKPENRSTDRAVVFDRTHRELLGEEINALKVEMRKALQIDEEE